MKVNLIFDGNYLYHLSFSVFSTYYPGQDMSEVLADKEKQQVLIRKCVMNMCSAARRFEESINRVVVVIDSYSWRKSIYEDYKYALTKVKDPWNDLFISVLGEFEALLRKRGLIVSRIPGAEGDDLMMLWAYAFNGLSDEETIIMTADSDIRQLITPNVSIFNFNSKFLKFYCHPAKETYWNGCLPADIQVIAINPLEIILYKVLMGDKSDNILKVRKGFGEKAFSKFIDSVRQHYQGKLPSTQKFEGYSCTKFALWIQSQFERFLGNKLAVEEIGQILFNVRLTWLSPSVYEGENEDILVNMAQEIGDTANSYSYNRAYTLEEFYGALIK